MNIQVPEAKSIFLAALELGSPAEWPAYLDGACGDDTELRRRVDALLKAHCETAGAFDRFAASPQQTVPNESPGQCIGPYKLLEVIGEGGMGAVYMAEQAHPVRRRVALKVIKPGMDSKQVIARFEAERQALALMDHPNIARVLDAGATESGRPYIVMELVRGIPITEHCDREQLGIPERLELFVLVCRAVQHAHQKGVIHRDIKPSNVLVTLHDGVPVPKVIDFGIAKATGQNLTDRTLFTGFAQFVGTPLYMSPEQAELSGLDVDTRSDIYSLGVLLYELLTGATPFDRETIRKVAVDEVRRIILEEEPPKPSTQVSSLGEAAATVAANRHSDPRHLERALRGDLDWVVMRALEKDRRRRYETANDLAADVMRYLTDRPVEACPPSTLYRLGKSARRNRVALTTAAVVAMSLLVGTALCLWQAVRATRSERRAEELAHQARRAVDEMYTQVAEKWLRDQPALTGLQREFLEKALAFYERFGGEQGTGPEARLEAVHSLYRVGAIRIKLGQLAEAEAALSRAVALGTDLKGRFPDRPGFRLVLAESRLAIASMYRDAGKGSSDLKRVRITEVGVAGDKKYFEFASKRYEGRSPRGDDEIRRAGSELAELRGARFEDPSDRRRLADAFNVLCALSTFIRRLPEAEAAGRAGFEIWTSLVKQFPREPEYRLGLARNHYSQGLCFMWWGDRTVKAEAALREAEALLSRLQQERPWDPNVRLALASTLGNLGVVTAWSKRYAEATEWQLRKLALCERLAEEFPDVPDRQEDLARTLNNLAVDAGRQGLEHESEAYGRRALAIGEPLAERHPERLDYLVEADRCATGLAGCLDRQDKHEEAYQVMERAANRARAFLEAHPDADGARPLYVNARFAQVDSLLALGEDSRAARTAAEWARSVLEDFTREELGPPLLSLCRMALEHVATVRADGKLSERYREALVRSDYLRFRALMKEADRRAPDDFETLCTLADSVSTAPEAARDPQLALEFAGRAHRQKPADGMARQSLGWARYRVGDWKGCIESLENQGPSYRENGDFFAAMAYCRLGDQALARTIFDRADRWFQGYEKRWKPGIYPTPALLRPVRSEAAALLGLEPPPAGADSEAVTTPPPPSG